MGKLQKRISTLPANVLADRVVQRLIEAEKALQHATTFHQVKLVADAAAAQEVFAHRQKLGEEVIGFAHQLKIHALGRLADLLREMPKAKGTRGMGRPKIGGVVIPPPKETTYAQLGVDKEDAKVARLLAELPDDTRDAIANREVSLAKVRRQRKRQAVEAELEDVATKEAKAIEGVYDVIVVDPPWPMEKIERDERPNQVEFDYPRMDEVSLNALQVPCADACHVWLWTTHRFLPMAFRLLDAWSLKYVCTFVWHKPGGFQPIDLPQYNCEFALYARRGSPSFLDTKAFPVCFDAPRGAHSEKPEQFYEVLRRVTAGRRLDMFNRRQIEGFDGWGKEAA